jgi:hypothetical protein
MVHGIETIKAMNDAAVSASIAVVDSQRDIHDVYPRDVVALPRSRTFLTPEQFERAKAVGMGRSRPLIHDIERGIRYAKRNKLFTADAIVEHREKRKLTLLVEADLAEFVAACAARRWFEEGD